MQPYSRSATPGAVEAGRLSISANDTRNRSNVSSTSAVDGGVFTPIKIANYQDIIVGGPNQSFSNTENVCRTIQKVTAAAGLVFPIPMVFYGLIKTGQNDYTTGLLLIAGSFYLIALSTIAIRSILNLEHQRT